MKVRIKFTKTGSMKFIGHLDLLRFFQKTFRRAEFEMEYSQGFNPHQIMSFAAPLAIGVTSEGEYLDIQIASSMSSEAMIDRLNSVMTDGITAVSWKKLTENSKNAMSIVAAAEYIVALNDKFHIDMPLQDAIDSFMGQDHIKILKKTKKSEQEVDIKPLIYKMEIADDNSILLFLATGSVDNLKPELVMEAFSNKLNITFNPFAYSVHRNDIFAKQDDQYISLNEIDCVEC